MLEGYRLIYLVKESHEDHGLHRAKELRVPHGVHASSFRSAYLMQPCDRVSLICARELGLEARFAAGLKISRTAGQDVSC
jgi:hypothetical protein